MIYIPTYGRPHTQKTYEALPSEFRSKTTFVIVKKEQTIFKKMGRRYIVCDKKGVPAARQMAIQESRSRRIIMLDDDLAFSRRTKNWTLDIPKLVKATEEDVGEAIEWMLTNLIHFPMVGLAARGNNNTEPNRFTKSCHRIMRAFGVDKSILKKHDIRFDKYKYWEDFHVNLRLLVKGYETVVNVDIVNDGATNSKGGCSSYRDTNSLLKERDKFLKEHGMFAKAVDKSAKSWGEGFKDHDTVPDLRIQWRKAYEYGSRSSSSRR